VVLTCVIVDDNTDFLDTASVLLQQEGVNVVAVAKTSAEAIQQVAEARPTVTLVDIYLGDESGLELARRLVDQPEGSEVLLISSYAETDVAEIVAASPAIGFLQKSRLSRRAIQNALGVSEAT
jgi:CheY-like chemotaxis protein